MFIWFQGMRTPLFCVWFLISDQPTHAAEQITTLPNYSFYSTLGTSNLLWNFDFYCGWELCCRDLKLITDREVCCFMISCKNSTNIDSVIDWLVKHSKSKNWEDDLLSCDVNLLVDVLWILMAALCYWRCGMGSWLTGFNSSDSCLSICSLLLVLWVLSWVYGMYLCIFVGARKWLCICTDWCE